MNLPFRNPFTLPIGVSVLVAALPAHALTINLTFDSTVTSLANASSVESASNYAAQQFQNLFSDPITINITVASVAGTGTLGESSTNLAGYYSYSTIRTALINDAKSSADATAVATLPATDPTGAQPGLGWATTRAQAKALGLIPSDSSTDGTFTFGSGFTYTFDPNNRAVSGAIDFIGVVEHEFSEIMGRIPGLGTNFGDGGPDYLPFDLFRYSAPGTRSLVGGSGNYFSINGGVTNLKAFNFPNGNGSDAQDWASGANDSFNAFSSASVKNDITPVDITAMDVIGYDPVQSTPEPGTIALAMTGLAVVGLRRSRRSVSR